MSPRFDSLCPIFLMRPGADRLEQIATTVSLRLGESTFLLTAAHVVGQRAEGDILLQV